VKSQDQNRGDVVGALVDGALVVEEADPRTFEVDFSVLFPEERANIAGAIVKRQREFISGRVLARTAMRRLGIRPCAVPLGEDRAPVWPQGVTGSITHADTWCAVAVARVEDVCALGIDIEDDSPLAEELWPSICTREEALWLESIPAPQRGHFAKVAFSAKESAYKAQYCLTRRFLEFNALSVELDQQRNSWLATFTPGHRPPEYPWAAVEGHWSCRHGLIATAAVIEV